jgi:MFS family permease
VERLVRSYYWYQAAANCVFYSPVFFVYYETRAGLDVATILWLQSYAVAVRAVLDLPFGAVADRWSRRRCLEASAAGYALGALGLVLSPALWTAVLAETLFASAAALKSGADSAFLFDALSAGGCLDRYPATEGRGQAVSSLASGATGIAGGFLAALDLRLPYVATFAAAVAGGAVAARLGGEEARRRLHASPATLVAAAARAARAPNVAWAIAVAATAVTGSHVYFYFQQPWLRELGVPLALFGIVFAATKVVTAGVATIAHRVDAGVGLRGTAALMAAVPAAGVAAMSVAQGPAAAVLVMSRGVLDGLWQPLVNVWMNRLVESDRRATMLSLQSLVARLALAAALAVLGAVAGAFGLRGALAAAAGALALAAVALTLAAPRGRDAAAG